jgi:hypothetical protein
VEGDTAKLSDGYYAVQALTKHVEKISAKQGSYVNMMEDDMTSTRVRKLLFIYFNRKALSREGAVRDAEDFAAYVKWLDSLNEEEEQEKQQQEQEVL